MTLAAERLKELDNPSLGTKERARLRRRLAADFIHGGQYEAAREALGELWRGIGERPDLEGLDEMVAAEALLQAGALSSWMGASRKVEGAQAKAKDLISESASLFEKLGETGRAALARSDLALCYWPGTLAPPPPFTSWAYGFSNGRAGEVIIRGELKDRLSRALLR